MKKLIILSAIALSGLIYNSASAEGSMQNGFRYGHDHYNNPRFENSWHRGYVQPRYYNEHRIEPFRTNAHFYQDRRHFEYVHYRNRW